MARTALSYVLLAVAAVFALRACCFVPAAGSLRGANVDAAAPAAAAIYGLSAAAVPEAAQAFTEKELDSFGLLFIPVSIIFFVAGIVRMFTLGKL
mmetsp:Transcript_1524/g.3347  ORF Transcript_1524/g.3347 Transcript_1524/m.3347 type:complete len:95 (-) Transcript_1524:81-365(-)|eukprot:CAMPEP_0178401988 /NCGR_PEP_ID=MMETSP0689_2-20121128/16602_1 /TAXON_ID=160604 /ORGANISM="Amphidinium massartii, Strain CS-259" /LENGTH=94 /DNA_ID=CAMNT_0020022859 /DNA_START=95 /DNA_END=379 /DNA_ORIENTATION=+